MENNADQCTNGPRDVMIRQKGKRKRKKRGGREREGETKEGKEGGNLKEYLKPSLG